MPCFPHTCMHICTHTSQSICKCQEMIRYYCTCRVMYLNNSIQVKYLNTSRPHDDRGEGGWVGCCRYLLWVCTQHADTCMHACRTTCAWFLFVHRLDKRSMLLPAFLRQQSVYTCQLADCVSACTCAHVHTCFIMRVHRA